MAYNQDFPANSDYLVTAPTEIRENFRALKEDKIVAADSAVKLETARTINDVAFDGTADITITQVNGKTIATIDQIPAASVSIPIGGIIIWSGSVTAIPADFALCNGMNGTPNLTDRFVLGSGNSYSVGAVGGEANHKLTIAEMPNHNFTFMGTKNGEYGASTDNTSSGLRQYVWAPNQTNYLGGDQPHNNMPPYYALAYIMRII